MAISLDYSPGLREHRVAGGVYAHISNICFLSASRNLYSYLSVDNTKNKVSATCRYISFASQMTVIPLKSTVTNTGEGTVLPKRGGISDHFWMGL